MGQLVRSHRRDGDPASEQIARGACLRVARSASRPSRTALLVPTGARATERSLGCSGRPPRQSSRSAVGTPTFCCIFQTRSATTWRCTTWSVRVPPCVHRRTGLAHQPAFRPDDLGPRCPRSLARPASVTGHHVAEATVGRMDRDVHEARANAGAHRGSLGGTGAHTLWGCRWRDRTDRRR